MSNSKSPTGAEKEAVGILGSAFDPLHLGHVALALLAVKEGFVESLWLCPSPDRWDKTPNAPLSQRIGWTKLCADFLQKYGIDAQFSDAELTLGEYRGTYEFLRFLKEKYPRKSFRLIVGEDSLRSISEWRDPVAQIKNGSKLLSEFSLLVAPRSQQNLRTPLERSAFPTVTFLPRFSERPALFPQHWDLQKIELLSSSEVRKQLEKGYVTEDWSLPEIISEIQANNPYLK